MSIQEVLKNSGIAFGTSGARGLVEDFSDDVCAAFTAAFLQVMDKKSQVQLARKIHKKRRTLLNPLI